jgi:hypothetical protein
VTFVKVVGDSDIYNFPVHLVLHFSSIFERKMSSKSPRLKWVRAAPRRIATSHARSAPRPRATPARQPPQRPRRRASRGSCVVQGRTFPRPTRAPRRLEVAVPCAAPPSRRMRAERRRSVRGPLPWARADRGRRHTTAASLSSSGHHRRACTIFKAVHPPRACATPPPLLPLHRARHGHRLASSRPCSPFCPQHT